MAKRQTRVGGDALGSAPSLLLLLLLLPVLLLALLACCTACTWLVMEACS